MRLDVQSGAVVKDGGRTWVTLTMNEHDISTSSLIRDKRSDRYISRSWGYNVLNLEQTLGFSGVSLLLSIYICLLSFQCSAVTRLIPRQEAKKSERAIEVNFRMSFLKKLEVDSESELTRWINDDIKPIEAGRRTWTFWTFHNYCKHTQSNFKCHRR
jgi:hypothetical protein